MCHICVVLTTSLATTASTTRASVLCRLALIGFIFSSFFSSRDSVAPYFLPYPFSLPSLRRFDLILYPSLCYNYLCRPTGAVVYDLSQRSVTQTFTSSLLFPPEPSSSFASPLLVVITTHNIHPSRYPLPSIVYNQTSCQMVRCFQFK